MLTQGVLKAQLLATLGAASTEAEGIENFANALGTYAAGATATYSGAPVPVTSVAISAGKLATRAAMVGINAVPGAGAPYLVAGVVAFWGAVAAGTSASFPASIGIVPPPLAGLAAALATALAANAAGGASRDTAMGRIATAIHSQTIIGGFVTFPPSVASPIL